MSALLRLLGYARPHRPRILKASAYSVINKLFDIAPEGLIGIAVDIVVNKQQSFLARLGYTDLMQQLWILGGVTLIIWMLESLFEYLYELEWRNLAQKLQHELRIDAYSHVQRLEMSWFENRSTGNLTAILNDDINQLERFLDRGANELIQVFTSVVVITGIFFYLAPSVAVFAMLPIPVILAGAFRFQKKLAPRYLEVREKAGALGGRIANNLGGIATIKSYAAENHEISALAKDSLSYLEANRRAIRLSSAFIPIIRMAILFGFVATLVLGGWLTLQGRLEVGAYSVLVFLTQRLLWPLTGLAQTVDLYERAMASTHRILDLVDTPINIPYEGKAFPARDLRGHVTFQSVSFAYQSGLPVLRNVTFDVPAGQTVALVGATGSGKSSIVKLLMRFYEISDGNITIDGMGVKEIDLHALRKTIGFVSQDTFLIDGTIAENISYGSFQATRDEIIAAARASEAHEFIMALPDGYDTKVGERGQKLSGGQRQRLSIARAILKNPPILILDEATSAVDNETEAAIQRSLERVSRNRTTIVIAHRLSTIRNAHRILVLEKGEIAEAGTHEELLREDGIYSSLWKVQTGDRSSMHPEK